MLCCSPCISVISITHPTPLTKLPGQKSRHSGIFKFGSLLVTVCELRQNFGVDPDEWRDPGRIIITELSTGHVGFWVDDILDVMDSPATGWGSPPPLIPKATFSRTLTFKEEIHLYAEFENLYAIKQTGYLKSYIEHLQKLNSDSDKLKNKYRSTGTDKVIKNDKENQKNILNSIEKEQTKSENLTSSTVELNKNSNSMSSESISDNKNTTESGLNKISETPVQKSLNTKTTKIQAEKIKLKPSLNTEANSDAPKDIKTNTSHKIDKTITKTITRPKIVTADLSKKENSKIKNTPENKKQEQTERSKLISEKNGTPDKSFNHIDTVINEQLTTHTSYTTEDENNSFGIILSGLVLVLILLFGSYFYLQFNDNSIIEEYAKNKDTESVTAEKPEKITAAKIPENSIKTGENNDHDTDNTKPENVKSEKRITLLTDTDKSIHLESNRKDISVKENSVVSEKNSITTETIESSYKANISNVPDGITITLHTPVTNEQFDSLKEKSKNTEDNIPIKKSENSVKNEKSTKIQTPDNSPEKFEITIQVDKNQKSLKIDPSTITKEIIHIVVKGDTLWDIAKFYVDNPYRYPELARLSDIKNPDLIYPGNRVHIIQIFTNGQFQND